jgi:hypothetical protein
MVVQKSQIFNRDAVCFLIVMNLTTDHYSDNFL